MFLYCCYTWLHTVRVAGHRISKSKCTGHPYVSYARIERGSVVEGNYNRILRRIRRHYRDEQTRERKDIEIKSFLI